MDDLKKQKKSLVYYFKAISAWIQIGVTIWKRSIQVKIGDFLSCVT